MNEANEVRFECNGCGRCCQNHHIPLTLDEAVRWVADGGQLIILVDGFVEDGPGFDSAQRAHLMRRSRAVHCATLQPRVMITFAAFNPGRCRYLQDDNRCGQYESRPLVCRIYPAEINPSITLNPQAKDCPEEVWVEGPVLIHRERGVDPLLGALIERSRQADRDEIVRKVAICERLGIHVSAIRGNGYTAWLPDGQQWLQALADTDGQTETQVQWAFETSNEQLAAQLAGLGIALSASASHQGAFIGLA
ncbi:MULTISPECIES: YkgJ family cysteine cluster protein [unclassified Pseudomonas]|uniref:YkgJ family cysteine cluster protein n=1 Tax=unclassified Pseudomonas TaxID=196821 RepID=UPI000D378CA7|nr:MULTISPECIES: YkgJ family cysteine cluster protein [unclassified Pseudomonas]RAU44121.1 YkgJ family cysteine cluster protein [Pseudomonas sp. RIT 409]RAU54866.1 YkgJ family cysteine cluster protein [Pseudomonas sp. RIT 412]